MKLPDIENACIRPEKNTQYLLSNNHPDGQHKARFFYSFGHLQAPDGRFPEIRSVWFIETGQITPYFVTAYPLKMP